jgi:type IV pilus assembly protein PilB
MAKNKLKKETRLGKLLLDAGLLTEDQKNRVESEYQVSQKAFTDILFQEVSLKTIKELLLYEVPMPGGRESTDEIMEEMVKDGLFTEAELEQLVTSCNPGEADIAETLLKAGFITPEQYNLSKEESEQTQIPVTRVLINRQYVTPKMVNDILKYHRQLIEEKLIGRLLVRKELLTEDKYREALEKRCQERKPLGQILVENHYLTPEQVRDAFDRFLDIPYLDLEKQNISSDAAKLLPESFIRDNSLLPVKKEKNTLVLAMLDPLNQSLIDDVALMTGCKIQPALAEEEALRKAIDRFFTEDISVVLPKALKEEAATRLIEGEESGKPRMEGIVDVTESTTVVSLVNSIITTAINSRATDIHIEPQSTQMRVRYRIDGMLYDVMTLTHEQELPVISRLKVISNMDITERRRPQDGHLSFDLENNSYDIRVATLPTHLGEKMVLRILDESKVLKGLFQLGFEPDDLEKVKGMCKKPYGMILETGPIGSGKTTTLYSCLNEINVMTSNIVTIEDPIEYQLPGINQVNVDAKVNLTFATGLRAILRQDADVLMVGEIRDAETAAIAVRAAMTGHLLFSTLHTNDAPGAITTLQHLGIKPFLISSSLIGVIAQRLVRKICLNCRQPYAPSPDEKELLGLSPKDKTKLYKGTGCEKCFRTGYHGRTGVFEVMQIDEELKDLIVHEAPEAQLRETAIQKGMSTLKMSGIQKVLDGTTTIEEMLRVINL